MKYLSLLFILTLCPFVCKAQLLDESEAEYRDYSDGKMFRQTSNALMRYELVQQKTEYWGDRLEKMLLGEYAEKVMVIAPLVTGKIEFNALDMNFYLDAREEKSGVQYTYNF